MVCHAELSTSCSFYKQVVRCTCEGWKGSNHAQASNSDASPSPSSSSSSSSSSSVSTTSTTDCTASDTPSAQTLQHQQLFQTRILLHKELQQTTNPETQQILQQRIRNIEQCLQKLDPAQKLALRQALTKHLDEICSTCRHRYAKRQHDASLAESHRYNTLFASSDCPILLLLLPTRYDSISWHGEITNIADDQLNFKVTITCIVGSHHALRI
jgi:hypothetical protein